MTTIKRLMLVTCAGLAVLTLTTASLPVAAEQEPTGDPKAERALLRAQLEKAFVICEHWGGEEAYDEQRAAAIKRGFQRDCLVAFLQAQHALDTMPGDPLVAAIAVDLESYAGAAFPRQRLAADAATKEKLCLTAIHFHAKSTGGKSRYRGYFQELCPAHAAVLPPP